MYRYPVLFSLIGCVAVCAQAVDQSYLCEAPDPIKAAITQVRPGGMEILLAEHPDDFWVRRAYIDSKVSGMQRLRGGSGIPAGPVEESVITKFRREYEVRSEDPEAAYLYAYALVHKNTAKSIEILNAIIQKTPGFPTAWITLAILHGYPNFYDHAETRKYTERFLALCPETTEPRVAGMAAQLDRSETLITYARNLRQRIAGKENSETLSLYPSLWQLESRLALPADQPEFRKRVENDITFLKGLDKSKQIQVNFLLLQAYQRVGNKVPMDDPAEDSTTVPPAVQMAQFLQAQSEWARSNPSPPPDAGSQTRIAYYKRQLEFLDQWREKTPRHPVLLTLRITALAAIPGTPDDVLVQEGDHTLAVLRESPTGSLPPTILDVLKVWAQRRLELNRIPALVREVMETQQKTPITAMIPGDSDLYGGSYQKLMTQSLSWTTNTKGWGILATVYAQRGEFAQARSVLAEWKQDLDARRLMADELNEKIIARARSASAGQQQAPNNSPVSGLESSFVYGTPREEALYYEAAAQLAAAEGRTLDALTFYQSSLRLSYGRYVNPPNFMELDSGKEAAALWKKLGGTDTGWFAWLDSVRTMPAPRPAGTPRWSGTNKAIPQFSLADQSGRTWTLDDLKGKATLINVWATWCSPCRAELPLLQKLYEQIKNRSDIQMVTLNIDENRNLVGPYLNDNKLSLPALFAKSFVDDFAGSIGIPTTWIADTSGTIRIESLGFGGGGDQWVQQTLKQIESVREGKTAALPAPIAIAPALVSSGKDIFYTPGSPVRPPRKIYGPVPAYTRAAREAKVQGIIVLAVIVKKDGTAGDVRVIRGLGYGLDESAIDTIRKQWKFEPGTVNGKPVDVQANIEVSFQLY